MATKYIVDNLSGQTITGNLTINGNITVTGITNNPSVGIYRALMTQTGSITGANIPYFGGGLIIGETYTINTYNEGDDFSNIANVVSGNINETGCVFIATGESPYIYINGSILQSDGGLVVSVLENTLGYDIAWSWKPFGGYGYYVAVNDNTGPLTNTFPRNNVQITTQLTQPYDWGFPYISITSFPASFGDKDDLIYLSVNDFDAFDSTDNALYYTPIEIKINYDLTPFVITPSVTTSYPFIYASFTLFCRGNGIGSYYSDDSTVVNNATELATVLNNSAQTNFLGTFSVNESDEIILTMTTSTKQQYCEDNVLTIQIFGSN